MARGSLPTRERELKHDTGEFYRKNRSLPTRERELKPSDGSLCKKHLQSLPTRERELKHGIKDLKANVVSRSPRGSVN